MSMNSTKVADDLGFDVLTPDSGIHDTFSALSAEEQEKQRQEWQNELVKTEDEIQTLRQVLASKVKHAQDIKRRLGITVWKEFSDDISSSFKSVKESETVQKAGEALSDFQCAVTAAPLYQKTAGAMSAVSEKTSGLFGGISAKFGALKETPTFKSFEERVGSVYQGAKTKVGGGSQTGSTQDFDEALRENEADQNVTNTGTVVNDMQQQQPAAS